MDDMDDMDDLDKLEDEFITDETELADDREDKLEVTLELIVALDKLIAELTLACVDELPVLPGLPPEAPQPNNKQPKIAGNKLLVFITTPGSNLI
jgi:hypothetical protein